jgi:hypothetical protein
MTTVTMPAAAAELGELTRTMTTHGGRSSPAPHKPLNDLARNPARPA